MCPDKKLEWFQTNPGWRSEDRLEADRVIRRCWTETYQTREGLETPSARKPAATAQVCLYIYLVVAQTEVYQPARKWASSSRVVPQASHSPDSIEAYLAAPVVSKSDLSEAEGGYRAGVLAYWEKALPTRPRLARMALDFLSAPGKPSLASISPC